MVIVSVVVLGTIYIKFDFIEYNFYNSKQWLSINWYLCNRALYLCVVGFMRSFWQLLCNGSLVVFTLHSVFDILVLMGMAGNMTRYLEIQFNLPAFKANIVTGQ